MNEVKTRVGCGIRRGKEQLESGCTAVRIGPTRKHVLELKEETWKIIQGLCLFFLFPYDMLILLVQLKRSTQLSYPVSFSPTTT